MGPTRTGQRAIARELKRSALHAIAGGSGGGRVAGTAARGPGPPTGQPCGLPRTCVTADRLPGALRAGEGARRPGETPRHHRRPAPRLPARTAVMLMALVGAAGGTGPGWQARAAACRRLEASCDLQGQAALPARGCDQHKYCKLSSCRFGSRPCRMPAVPRADRPGVRSAPCSSIGRSDYNTRVHRAAECRPPAPPAAPPRPPLLPRPPAPPGPPPAAVRQQQQQPAAAGGRRRGQRPGGGWLWRRRRRRPRRRCCHSAWATAGTCTASSPATR